jgi:hypothetical protein
MERIEPVHWQSPVQIERIPPVERTLREQRKQSERQRPRQPPDEPEGDGEDSAEPDDDDRREHIDISA